MINWFEKILLKQILRHSCPDSSPRSGKCYVVWLKLDTKYLFCVNEIRNEGFLGTTYFNCKLNEHNFNDLPACCVPFNLMNDLSIEIKRYIGLWNFTYSSVLKCVLHDWTFRNRIPIVRDEIAQFLFNKRDLALKERINVLEDLIEKYIEKPDVSFSKENLLNIIHSRRWSRHPDSAKQLAHARIILDSLRESGELQEDKDTESRCHLYKLTGKALTSLEIYERDKKRHNQIKNLTCALVVVGIIQAIAGFIQAYIAYKNVKLDYQVFKVRQGWV